MDAFEAAETLGRLRQAQEDFEAARIARHAAILECVSAEVPLRDVAREAACSHETIRRIAASDGAATLQFADTDYSLSSQTVKLLVYKLSGFARGAFSADRGALQAGTEWLAGADVLSRALVRTPQEDEPRPVVLDDLQGFALHQVLRFTAMERPSALSGLAEALAARYGFPPYRQADLRRWTTPSRRQAHIGR